MGVDYSSLPIVGSKWEVDGVLLTVDVFQAKGRDGYIVWSSHNGAGGKTKLSEWKKKAKAA